MTRSQQSGLRWVRACTTMAAASGLAAVLAGTGCGPKVEPLTPGQQSIVAQADPDMKVVLDQLHQLGGKSFSTLTVDEARKGPSAADAAKKVAEDKGVKPVEVGDTSMTSAPGRDGTDIPLKVYTPKGDATSFPVIVYFHGGGWVVGKVTDANPYDASCRAMCSMAHAVVVEVDYRLAPEHPYPAAVNDGCDALAYVEQHPDKFKGNGKLALMGESAGGNLAVAVALMAKDKGLTMPGGIMAVYPVAGYYVDTNSAKQYAEAVPLDTPSLRWFYDQYVPSMANRSDRYFDLLKGDLHGLPMTTVITDQIDPLHDDGARLADALKSAGVDTTYMNYDGVTHEFFGMGTVVAKAKEAEQFAASQLMKSWGMSPSMSATMMPGM